MVIDDRLIIKSAQFIINNSLKDHVVVIYRYDNKYFKTRKNTR